MNRPVLILTVLLCTHDAAIAQNVARDNAPVLPAPFHAGPFRQWPTCSQAAGAIRATGRFIRTDPKEGWSLFSLSVGSHRFVSTVSSAATVIWNSGAESDQVYRPIYVSVSCTPGAPVVWALMLTRRTDSGDCYFTAQDSRLSARKPTLLVEGEWYVPRGAFEYFWTCGQTRRRELIDNSGRVWLQQGDSPDLVEIPHPQSWSAVPGLIPKPLHFNDPIFSWFAASVGK